jgi:DNA-directed RNA polymerase subunit M/transcription elongation factor TFIIS
LHSIHPLASDSKAYQSKSRTLIFNLKKNAVSLFAFFSPPLHFLFSSSTRITNTHTPHTLYLSLQPLRESLRDGSLTSQSIVHLPSSALATEDIVAIRHAAIEEATNARRSDWIAANRDKIMRDNGLDPTGGTEFKCSKCKGTRTTFYALQTRSADEPMTLFVTCLTCGKRWRTS